MQFNVVKEIYKLRAGLLKTVNCSPLPTTIKLMVVNELKQALDNAEISEIRSTTAKESSNNKEDSSEKEG